MNGPRRRSPPSCAIKASGSRNGHDQADRSLRRLEVHARRGTPMRVLACRAPASPRSWAAHGRAHGSTPPSLEFERILNLSRALFGSMERKKRFELSTPSLARRCSTAELLPQASGSIPAESGLDNSLGSAWRRGHRAAGQREGAHVRAPRVMRAAARRRRVRTGRSGRTCPRS